MARSSLICRSCMTAIWLHSCWFSSRRFFTSLVSICTARASIATALSSPSPQPSPPSPAPSASSLSPSPSSPSSLSPSMSSPSLLPRATSPSLRARLPGRPTVVGTVIDGSAAALAAGGAGLRGRRLRVRAGKSEHSSARPMRTHRRHGRVESQALCALRHRLQARTRCGPFESKAADVKVGAEDEADVKVDDEGKTEEGATVEGEGKKLDGSITSSGGMSSPSCCCAWRAPSGRRCSIPSRFVLPFFTLDLRSTFFSSS